MLICSVSQRARRAAIAADLIEAATATDANTTGNVIFATLVDDPASVGEVVDAFLGEIMLEAASASDSISAGAAYTDGVGEAVTAVDTLDAATGVGAVARQAVIIGPMFVNSDTTPRQANINGIMVNL